MSTSSSSHGALPTLSSSDITILESTDRWITDSIIVAVQELLKKQCDGKIFGWQSPQMVKRKDMFKPLPMSVPFIQVLHVNGNHWVTVSNIRPKSDPTFDSVGIYDSNWLSTSKIRSHTMEQICSFFKSKAKLLCFDVVSVERQKNLSDCGVFALAHATELVYGDDPSVAVWDTEKMRKHIINSVENGYVLPFPKLGRRRVGLRRIVNSYPEPIHCLCRMPDDGNKYIECLQCIQWFHVRCVSLQAKKFETLKWICSDCEEFNRKIYKE